MPDALTSTASRPALVTTRDRPSVGRDGEGYRSDLGQAKTEIFLQTGRERQLCKTPTDWPVGHIRAQRMGGILVVNSPRRECLEPWSWPVLRGSLQHDGYAPWSLRSAKLFAADPGSTMHSASPLVPALRCIVKNAAPRPRHEMHCFTLSQDDGMACGRRSRR